MFGMLLLKEKINGVARADTAPPTQDTGQLITPGCPVHTEFNVRSILMNVII